MAKKLLTLLFIFSFSTTFSQDSAVYFSDAIKANINTYNKASNRAFDKKDFIEGQRLFDSLVQYKLLGTQFDDFTIKSYNSKSVKLNKINKPVFIITYASWCVLSKGEIPALNKLAKEHRDDIQFIVLFWDKKSNIKKIAHQFSNNIKICYADEGYDNDYRIVSTIKHTLGFPTSFFLDENKKVISIKRISNQLKPRTSFATALSLSYDNFSKNINESILNKTVVHSRLVAN
ncbi:MAG: redoxin domain-containing protein [Flavobacterium sp.]